MERPKLYNRSTGRVAFEKCATLGPMAIGESYDKGIFPWVSRIYDDSTLHLFVALTPGNYTEVIGELPATVTGSRHNIAFDQSGRASLSYLSGGGILVRQYDTNISAFVDRGPFAGVDPVLFNDYFVGLPLGESDLILFYLSADRLSIKYRIQVEFFATERTLYTLPAAHNMDKVALGYLKYQLHLADVSDNKLYLISDLYPYLVSNIIKASMRPVAGVDILNFEYWELFLDEGLITSMRPAPGFDSSESSIFSPPNEGNIGTMFPRKGVDEANIFVASPDLNTLKSSMLPRPGTDFIAIVNTQTLNETANATMSPIRSVDKIV